MQLFRNPKEINSAQRNDPDKLPEEYPIKYVARSIKNLPDKIWTSIELHELYKENRGEENKRSRFLTKLIAHFENEFYHFTSPGLAGIVMLKGKTFSMFKTVSEDHNDDDDDDDDVSV